MALRKKPKSRVALWFKMVVRTGENLEARLSQGLVVERPERVRVSLIYPLSVVPNFCLHRLILFQGFHSQRSQKRQRASYPPPYIQSSGTQT